MIDIVIGDNISRFGQPFLQQGLCVPHHIRQYPCDLAETEVLVSSVASAKMLEQAPRLRLVHTSGAGFDNVAMAALPPHVALCNVFHHERAMAEYVLMTMLAMDRKLFHQDRNLRAGLWEGSCVTGPPLASELAGKTLGILGYGHIGREVARLAAAFDVGIVGLASRHTREELEGLLAGSDFLLVACPMSEATRGLIGRAELALMQPGASLINVARGGIVDEEPLYEALRDRRIRAAAIDVWYRYPRDGQPCLPSKFAFHELDNVILTPHSSGWTERVVERRFRDIAENINRLAAGEPLMNVIPRN